MLNPFPAFQDNFRLLMYLGSLYCKQYGLRLLPQEQSDQGSYCLLLSGKHFEYMQQQT